MKRLVLLLLSLIILIFAGCGDNKLKIDYSDKYVFGQDSQENVIAYQSRAYLAESGDSYYYYNWENGFLYVIDRSEQLCQSLCNKSDCLHEKEADVTKCNAYIGVGSYPCVCFYNNRLYFQNSRQVEDKDGIKYSVNEIYRMSLDGTERSLIYSTRDAVWNFKIHRGYIYFTATKYDDGEKLFGNDAALYRLPVSGNSEPEEILEYYSYKNILVVDTRFYTNSIILLIERFVENTDAQTSSADEAGTSEKYLINYDIETGEWINLSEKLNVNVENMFTVFNGKIVFNNNKKIYECDLDGSNEREVLNAEKVLDGYEYYTPYGSDGENLLITAADDANGTDTFILCDKNYQPTVYKLPMKLYLELACDTDAFIVQDEVNSKLYLIDKSQLGDNIEVKELYDFSA